ncbi:MAG TPA: hypothetical protein VGF50_13270 [Caulobacteraceae bacterium]
MSEAIDGWRTAAERALGACWGAPVACQIVATLRDKGRNRVFRLAVEGGPVGSVILKACVGDEQAPYVRGDPNPAGSFRRLCNEWAAGAVLAPLGLGPQVHAADAERGCCVEEDLGDGETLAARLTGDDPAAAEAALFAYARSLADMHRATQGMADRWRALLAERGAAADDGGHFISTPWRFAAPACKAVAEELGFAPPPRLERDLAAIADALDRPGGYLAFTPTDCCPDNHYLRGDRVVFFDCEGAQVRHALLDAAYFLAPFPTCWCCAALPGDLPQRLIAAYRESFPGDAAFDDQLTMALAAWLTAGLAIGRNAKWLDEDGEWGLSTLRQRRLEGIRRLLARPGLATLLPGVADFAAELDQRLRVRWPGVQPMPLYSAFA